MQGTKHFKIHYATSSPLELVGFFDSDWGRDLNDKKYTLGFVFMLSNGTILLYRTIHPCNLGSRVTKLLIDLQTISFYRK